MLTKRAVDKHAPSTLPDAILPQKVVVVPLGTETRRMTLFPLSFTYSTPVLSRATDCGCLKLETDATPSTYAAAPFPETVATTPVSVTLRTRCVLNSVKNNRVPALSSAMPTGPLNPAAGPLPSAYVAKPPARVVTRPALGSMVRMRLPLYSVT